MERFLDTKDLPKKSQNMYDWKNSVGCKLLFQYGEHTGYIEIKDYITNKYKLLISVNGKEKEIFPNNLLNLAIGDIFYGRTYDFKYEIGYVFGHENNKMKIISRYRESRKMYHAKCLICGYKKCALEHHIKENKGCPVCDNKIVVKGINDIWTTNPKLAELLVNPEEGYMYTENSNVKLIWKCPNCGKNTEPLYVNNVNHYGLSCKFCSDGFSYPNKFIKNLLVQLNVNFKSEKKFKWSDNKIYDFYLPNQNCIIEAHGEQHYNIDGFYNLGGRTLEEEQTNDLYKEKLAKDNGIEHYITIDCRYSDAEYIYNNIISSKLSMFFDMSQLDYNYLGILSEKNIFLQVVNLYKETDCNFEKIMKDLNISYNSINRYLNRAEKLGLIKYDKKKNQIIASQKRKIIIYQKYAKPIICLENGYVFGNHTIASKNSLEVFGFHISSSGISISANKNKSVYKLHFQYISRKEFNTIKMNTPHKCYGDYFDMEDIT